jgi:hypothetical protein
MAEEKTGASRFSRRNFLSAAALGAAYVAAGPAASVASASSGLVSTSNVDAFEGILRGFAHGTFEIETGTEMRQIMAPAGSTFWKGGETSWDSFSAGDSILVRTVGGQLDRAWANLTRMHGRVVSRASNKLTVAHDHGGNDRFTVLVPKTARIVNSFTAEAGRVSLPLATSVDVIGLQTPSGLVASVIGYALPDAKPLSSAQPAPTVTRAASATPDVLMCTYNYNNFASWYNCPTGAGSCGTCSTSNSSQCAWPAQETCGCCSGNGCGCDCNHGCITLAIASCGHHVQVTDACSSKYRDTVIADCGPCMSNCGCSTNVCGHTCNLCGKSRTHPVVDLTKPTFAVFRDPASYGCFPAKVSVTIPC